MLARLLDALRVGFPYIVAFLLPFAGVVIAVVRYSQGDRDDALRIAAAAVLGISVYGLLFM